MPSRSKARNPPEAPYRFATTQWSLVLSARERGLAAANDALAELCTLYWYPLYAFIRRQGYGADEAQDLTQGFFARLLEKDFLASVAREKGRFRSFLLAACKHFLSNERDRARALKRGGGEVALDFGAAEQRYAREPAHVLTPERLFERRWALTLLEQVLARLREEITAAGKGALFERLKGFLVGDEAAGSYRDAAKELQTSEGAVKVMVHRLRRRYKALLREEIERTVGEGRAEAEIRHLRSALGAEKTGTLS
jgi:RNA polymerase sigma-70 factor (ECF subfamily)